MIARPLNQPLENTCHEIQQNDRPRHHRRAHSMSRVRRDDCLINYSQHFCNYAGSECSQWGGGDGSLAARPKGWSAYLLPAAVWQQGHQTEAAFLVLHQGWESNAVPLNPSQQAQTRGRTGEGGGGKIREQGGMVFMVEVPWVMWFISHTPPLLPFVNKAVMQPV